MYKISFFVPVEHCEVVKNAMFSAGAGKVGNYDMCCFETQGRGQFRPLEGSNPTIGKHKKVEQVDELKVEMVCLKEHIESVILQLKKNHPYETPAYDVIELENY